MGMRTETDIKRLGFLIFQGFPMASLTSMIEPLRAANEIFRKTAFEWQVIGETAERVTSSAAVGFDPDIRLANSKSLDYMFLIGNPQSTFNNPKRSNGILRRLVRHGMSIDGISGGVFPLARAGFFI